MASCGVGGSVTAVPGARGKKSCGPTPARTGAGAGVAGLKRVVDLSPPAAIATSSPTRSKTQATGAKEKSTMRIVALDLAVRKIVLCEVREGAVIMRRTVSSVSGLKEVLGPQSASACVAIEACREAWHVHDVLAGWGHKVVLVDTTRVRQLGIGQHGRKTDRIDAEVLARALQSGRIPVAHILSPARQHLRKELGVRRALVEVRAQYVVTVRGILRGEGVSIGKCDTDHFVAAIKRAALTDEQRTSVTPLMTVLEHVDAQLAVVDARVEKLCAQEPAIERLTTVPGVGLIVAATFVSAIDEAKRFRRAHQLEAYLGLVPSEDSSGDRRRIGAITKHGNPDARAMLVQAAWCIQRAASTDDPLRLWSGQLAKRRGKNIAVVALARKLAGVLWAMWRHDTVYDAALAGQASAQGLECQAQSVEVRAEAMKRAAHKAKVRARNAVRRTQATPQVAP